MKKVIIYETLHIRLASRQIYESKDLIVLVSCLLLQVEKNGNRYVIVKLNFYELWLHVGRRNQSQSTRRVVKVQQMS